jgi:hypothetical protein
LVESIFIENYKGGKGDGGDKGEINDRKDT